MFELKSCQKVAKKLPKIHKSFQFFLKKPFLKSSLQSRQTFRIFFKKNCIQDLSKIAHSGHSDPDQSLFPSKLMLHRLSDGLDLGDASKYFTDKKRQNELN